MIPLKGPALAEALYPDPGLRPFTDLDLLVRREDAARAVALLGEVGRSGVGAMPAPQDRDAHQARWPSGSALVSLTRSSTKLVRMSITPGCLRSLSMTKRE